MDSASSDPDQLRLRKAIDLSIRLGLVALLLIWAFRIVAPFVPMVAWAGIIAVAIYPLFLKIRGWLGGRDGRAAGLITAVGIAIIILPTVSLTASSMGSVKALGTAWEAGTLELPLPGDRVAELPLVGEKLHAAWTEAAEHLPDTLVAFEDQLKAAGTKLLGFAAATAGTVLKFTFSLIIAGVFLAHAAAASSFMVRLSRKLVGEAGEEYLGLSTATVRSVAQGVLGIAVIQSLAAGLGMAVMGIPLAGLWAFGVLFLAIIQLPPILVLGPVIAYAFSAFDTVPAVIFAVYAFAVSICDTFLKPLLLGRGVDIPMLVILIGAIGGMMLSGIVGLFVGSVVLALVYRLFVAWLEGAEVAEVATP